MGHQPQFEGSRGFKNGYAAAKQNDKWGMIDKQGIGSFNRHL